MKQLTWILAACAGVIAAGCGQKGPLVLPDKNAKVITRPGGSKSPPPATPSEQTPPGQSPPAQAPQDSAPQPPPGPTSQGPLGTTKPPSGQNDDSSTNSTPR